jgi:CBS domain-containing protein
MRQDQAAPGTKSQTVNLQDMSATVADILSGKGGDVFSIGPSETLGRAVEVLRDRRIGALIVVDGDGALVGILSERDIVRKLAETPGQTLPQLVGDVMTREVKTSTSDTPLMAVLKQMTGGRFRHMPIVDQGTLVGMVTIGDVIQFRLTQLEHEALHLKQLIIG